MTPNTATGAAFNRNDDCGYTDPVFAALRKEREAFQAYSDILIKLARMESFSSERPTDALVDLELERLPCLEVAEAKASAAFVAAEQDLLATKPISIKGAIALLQFLRKHLSEDTDIHPVLQAISNIESLLDSSDSNWVVRYDRGYL